MISITGKKWAIKIKIKPESTTITNLIYVTNKLDKWIKKHDLSYKLVEEH